MTALIQAKPVETKDVLMQNGKIGLDFSILYMNLQSSDNVVMPQTYQTGNGDFVTVPSYYGTSKSNQDYFSFNTKIKYGLSNNFELFSSINMHYSIIHTDFANKYRTSREWDFGGIDAGAIYQVKQEDDTPAILLGTNINVYTKTKQDNKSYTYGFKNFRVFATTFYTVDPIVFSLTGSYSVNLQNKIGNHTSKMGNLFSLKPMVYFAVNPSTSLYAGIRYTHNGVSKIDSKNISNSGSDISYIFGGSYEFVSKTILSVEVESKNNNKMKQNSISTSLSYKF